MANGVEPGKVTTVEGGKPSIAKGSGRVKVGKAKVVAAEFVATNGAIHAIDTGVMLD